uniref:Dihydropteroate synthase n=1 Tax=candidate division WOR-3 bacterium TaxID=2052148 RepID=A0A7V3ZVC4_UNCW3
MRLLSLMPKDLVKELRKVGVSEEAIPIFLEKASFFALKLENLSQAAGNILKQVALACGQDCAIHKKVISGRKKISDAILFTNKRQLKMIVEKLSYQGDFLKKLKEQLTTFLEGKNDWLLNFRNVTYNLKERPLIMGILNLTPDSFYDGGKFKNKKEAIAEAVKMEEEGADIIDIGGESTRPGSEPVSWKEELKRVMPVLKEVRKKIKIPISIDTYKSEVAKEALEEGAEIVNDISGLSFDKKMAEIVSRYNAYCVIMHIKGRPKTMQKRVYYRDVIKEIYDYLKEKIAYAEKMGIKREKIIIDPGIGFGKKLEHNIEIIRRLGEFKTLNLPILVGHSRKSFIGEILSLPPEERLIGSLAVAVISLLNGAHILRVHDVKATKQVVEIFCAIMKDANNF